jgi:hypothetical protein
MHPRQYHEPSVFDPIQRLFDDPPVARWCRDATLRWWLAARAHRQTSPGEEDARLSTLRTAGANAGTSAGANAIRPLLDGPGASLSTHLPDPVALARDLGVTTRYPHEHVARGVVVGVVVHAYLTWVLAECRRLGLRRAFFVSREGATLARAFRALARAHSGPRLHATYLPASRLSTFLPSLTDLSAASLARLWKQYPSQTLAQLLRNLSLPHDDFAPLAAKHALEPNRVITDLAFLRDFFADPAVQHAFTTHRDRARDALAAYLTHKGFFVDRAIAMGDVGWKGSIQTNIEHAMRAWHAADASRPATPTLHGFYLALRRDSDLATPPSTRSGFIADEPASGTNSVINWPSACIFRCGSMFEVALSVPHRCVAAYTANSAPARPQLLPDTDPLFASLNARERDIFLGPARLTRTACRTTLRVMAANTPRTPLNPPLDVERARPWLVDLLRREIIYPTRASADSFLEHAHVETFGVFQPSRFDFVTPWREVLRGSPIHWPHRVRVALEAHFWPDAIVRRSGIPLANFAFDLMLTRRARQATSPLTSHAAE